jgi:hypothetical protein
MTTAPDPDRLIIAVRVGAEPVDYITGIPALARVYRDTFKNGKRPYFAARVMNNWPLLTGRRLRPNEFTRMIELAATIDEEHELEARPDAA